MICRIFIIIISMIIIIIKIAIDHIGENTEGYEHFRQRQQKLGYIYLKKLCIFSDLNGHFVGIPETSLNVPVNFSVKRGERL